MTDNVPRLYKCIRLNKKIKKTKHPKKALSLAVPTFIIYACEVKPLYLPPNQKTREVKPIYFKAKVK